MWVDALFYYIYKFMQFSRGLVLAFFDGDLARLPSVAEAIHWYKVIAIIVSCIFAAGIVWVLYNFYLLKENLRVAEKASEERVAIERRRTPNETRWQFIQDKLNSQNESDWRMAIIEADTILEEIVGTMRLPGMSLGERMKAIEKSDFNTLDEAWDAHKSRNRIAHDGSSTPLLEREARRIIGLYEKVFREFEYI